MRLLICGDRDWSDWDAVERVVEELKPDVVIQGDARGADTIAAEVAEALGIKVLSFPANWERYGRGAGHIRNQQMLDLGKPDRVVAFHANIDKSKGTKDMVARARKAGIPTEVVTG